VEQEGVVCDTKLKDFEHKKKEGASYGASEGDFNSFNLKSS